MQDFPGIYVGSMTIFGSLKDGLNLVKLKSAKTLDMLPSLPLIVFLWFAGFLRRITGGMK